MDRFDKNENILRVFNTAKLMAEGILFPKMKLFSDFQLQADFGAKTMEEAVELSEEIRELQRYNGLKGMTEVVYNLCLAISSTVRLHNNKEENKQLDDLMSHLKILIDSFYNDRSKFFKQEYRNGHIMEVVERTHFEKIKDDVNICYVNTEILMTRNKLLFADSNDDFASDSEVLEQLKKEYIEG
jgi:hypothetical protein